MSKATMPHEDSTPDTQSTEEDGAWLLAFVEWWNKHGNGFGRISVDWMHRKFTRDDATA